MIKSLFTKEERQLFSKRNFNKIKKDDFVAYIHMYEAQLESLRNGYSPEVYKNPIVENIIDELDLFIQDLNDFYYNHVLAGPEKPNKMDQIDFEITEGLEYLIKPIDREITRELNELKKMETMAYRK